MAGRTEAAGRRPIGLCEPVLDGNEWRYLQECLETGWVSSAGPFVDRFEQALAAYVGAAEAVGVVNGTAGLHVALQVVGVQAGDEVLVSALTFVAPANAVRYCGAHPVFADADPGTWQIEAGQVERFLAEECEVRRGACYNRRTGRRVRAIVPVHILGLSCEIDRIVEAASSYHLRVVEDAAEALGVRYRGRHVGTFGDVGVFSFNGNKIVTSGGGGMIVTRDADAARYARYLTTQAKDDGIEYIHHEVGYNYRLTSLQAALGLAQLERIGEFLGRKRAIACAYEASLKPVEGVTLMPTPPQTQPSYWLYTVLLDERTTLAERQAVVSALNARGLGARPLWHPLHSLPPYRDCQTLGIRHAARLYERAVSLPSGAGLSADDLRRCTAAAEECLQAHGGRLTGEARSGAFRARP